MKLQFPRLLVLHTTGSFKIRLRELLRTKMQIALNCGIFKKYELYLAGTIVASLDKKLKKYRHLNNNYYVVPVAIETLGSSGPYALNFIKDIGVRIKESTGEKRATSYLMQAIGMAIQRGNSQCHCQRL